MGRHVAADLLEKSRVTHQMAGVERNYHVFYFLLSGSVPQYAGAYCKVAFPLLNMWLHCETRVFGSVQLCTTFSTLWQCTPVRWVGTAWPCASPGKHVVQVQNTWFQYKTGGSGTKHVVPVELTRQI